MRNVSEFGVGLAHEFMITAAKAGFTPDDIANLAHSEEKMRKTKRFVDNGCQFVIKGPGALVVDRTTPFDPAKFIGSGWEIVEEDKKALALTTVDFSNVRFESGLKEGESVIDGEEKLKRLKRLGIRLDAKFGQTLFEEKGQATLRWLYDTFGITWFELSGTVLRDSRGSRYFLYLRRDDDGSWHWRCNWLDYGRSRVNVSPLLAS
ncbi:MAG: hypothetical protein KGI70_01085 [Patescibacteria group bacterium]|nr:hypothetical protein [Patescibacteria group bacterium]